MKKYWYKYFVYISLLFLALALYHADYLKVPIVLSFPSLVTSLFFLFMGFMNSALSWKEILKKSDYQVRLRECLAGTGLSIFGKYIPGKVWIIVGRAAYVSETGHYSLGRLSAISLNAQFIDLWAGLILGTIGLFILGSFHWFSWVILCMLLGLTMIIFTERIHNTSEYLLNAILRKEIKIPRLTIKATLAVIPWFVLSWFFWSLGFYALFLSLCSINVKWSIGLGFPLAGSLGIMAIITPGGLVAREGVMVGFLNLAGIPVVEATTIAVASRLWFLAGEVFIFIVGLIVHRRSSNSLNEVGYER